MEVIGSQNHDMYNEVLQQLLKSNMILQEVTQNLAKEQVSMREMVTRIQTDLEHYKESQNNRFDDMMRNTDCDLKKVYNDLGNEFDKLQVKVTKTKVECVDVKEYYELKSDFEELKLMVKSKFNHNAEVESVLHGKVDNIIEDVASLRNGVEKSLAENSSNSREMKASIEKSCTRKFENYIETEILEEIVSTVNLKLNNVKSEFQEELEKNRIKIDDMSTMLINLKRKVADIENPRRCFNESDIHMCSIDDTKTPMRTKSMSKRLLVNPGTPLSGLSYSTRARKSSLRYFDSTPICQHNLAGDDETMVEITDAKDSVSKIDKNFVSPSLLSLQTVSTETLQEVGQKSWLYSLVKSLKKGCGCLRSDQPSSQLSNVDMTELI